MTILIDSSKLIENYERQLTFIDLSRSSTNVLLISKRRDRSLKQVSIKRLQSIKLIKSYIVRRKLLKISFSNNHYHKEKNFVKLI